jgi:hypothetical protein
MIKQPKLLATNYLEPLKLSNIVTVMHVFTPNFGYQMWYAQVGKHKYQTANMDNGENINAIVKTVVSNYSVSEEGLNQLLGD